jgi:UDP-N-acetylmuramoyl-L-alanine---L-glutamate ligase
MNYSNPRAEAVFQPTGFADLAGRRVGIFGVGVEGRATRRRVGSLAGELILVDDAPHEPGVMASAEGGLDALRRCDVVLKSPGIPRRRADIVALENAGVTVTSALNLWLGDVDRSRVIAITGTKGKSTTTSLVAFFLRCVGDEAHELGNFGTPPYDPDVDTARGWLVLEVSSYQAVDITRSPRLVLVTSLGADHLDWHGSLAQYHEDKLALTRAAGEHQTLVADTPTTRHALALMGGRLTLVATDDSGLATQLGLVGAHNDHNVGLALAAVAAATGRSADEVRLAVVQRASTYVPLRGRLTLVTTRERGSHRWRYIDDGLATGPLPTIAALDVVASEPVALIAGGFDRGVDYGELASVLRHRQSTTSLITLGPAGERLGLLCPEVNQRHVDNMAAAVHAAEDSLPDGGVVLFSPAAPSFDAYRNWRERSDDFARIAAGGRDADATDALAED